MAKKNEATGLEMYKGILGLVEEKSEKARDYQDSARVMQGAVASFVEYNTKLAEAYANSITMLDSIYKAVLEESKKPHMQEIAARQIEELKKIRIYYTPGKVAYDTLRAIRKENEKMAAEQDKRISEIEKRFLEIENRLDP